VFRWIKRRTQIWIANSFHEDIQRFIKGLEGGTDRDMAMLLCLAHTIRVGLDEEGLHIRSILDHELPDAEFQLVKLQNHLSNILRMKQKEGKMPAASALMIWLHSARSLSTVEIRSNGRQMWRLISRGADTVVEMYRGDFRQTFPGARPISESDLFWVPAGLR